jgi:hypothetical protein
LFFVFCSFSQFFFSCVVILFTVQCFTFSVSELVWWSYALYSYFTTHFVPWMIALYFACTCMSQLHSGRGHVSQIAEPVCVFSRQHVQDGHVTLAVSYETTRPFEMVQQTVHGAYESNSQVVSMKMLDFDVSVCHVWVRNGVGVEG